MAIQIQGNGGITAEVDANTRAMRVAQRPIDYGSLGVYQLAVESGVMAAGLAANAEVCHLRWTSATSVALVTQVLISSVGTATAFAAGATAAQLMFARAWTVAGTLGATATLSGDNAKLRTSMGTISTLAQIRTATTVALGAGTKTLDAQPIQCIRGGVPATAWTPPLGSVYAGGSCVPLELYNSLTEDTHPLVLTTNEGLVVRATVPATGTWGFCISFRLTEVDAY